MSSRVLVLTDDRLGPAMAGPAIRALELARALAPRAAVTLASSQPVGTLDDAGVPVVEAGEPARLRELALAHDVLVAGGLFFAQRPGLMALDRGLVLDLYAPFLLEDLARLSGELGELQHAQHRALVDAQLARADFMLCASERQRDYWLGRLCALGRLTPASVAGDPTASRLLAVVPFGLPAGPPTPGPARLRGVLPGVGPEARVFVWGGGLWDWLDPLTPIRAIARAEVPEARLVFLAGRSPNPTTPPMPVAERARALAAELGVLGTAVHFVDDWIPYAARGGVLLEADAGVTAHHDSLESRFAFRTRALDYVWAERPIVCTRGDVIAERVEREGLGLAVAPGDVDGWAAAFERVARDGAFVADCRARLAAVRPGVAWARVAEPLVEYVAAPWRAPRAAAPPDWALGGPTATLAKAWLVWRAEGARGLAARLERARARRRGGTP